MTPGSPSQELEPPDTPGRFNGAVWLGTGSGEGYDLLACSYGVISPYHLQWFADRGRPTKPSPATVLLMVSLFRPDELSLPDENAFMFPYSWPLLGGADDERTGRLLNNVLSDTALPTIQKWMTDPVALADNFRGTMKPGFFPGMSSPRAIAMALLAGGPSAALREALDALEPDDMVRSWIEPQLRSAGSQSNPAG